MASIQVVLDTNVIISGMAYTSSVSGKIMQAWRSGAIEVYLSDYILDEVRRVLPRLRHRHGLSDAEVDDLVDIMSFLAEIIYPADLPADAVRDRKDTPVRGSLVTAAHHHSVDYLVTGDKDLLALAEIYPIISPSEFWNRHGDL